MNRSHLWAFLSGVNLVTLVVNVGFGNWLSAACSFVGMTISFKLCADYAQEENAR